MCRKLFIIGNGFDLAHEVESSYSDFKNFLEENYTDTYDFVQTYCRPEMYEWQDFEDSLKYFDPEESCYSEDVSMEEDELLAVSNIQSHIEEMNQESKNLVERFSEWIGQVESNIQSDAENIERSAYFEHLISNGECYFLTFNYTDTLEIIYNISSDRICHIHGRIERGESPIFGHGEEPMNYSRDMTNGWGTSAQIEMINDSLNSSYNRLIKNVRRILMENRFWFSQLGTFDQIYSFGFSYNDIDMYYIQDIIEHYANNDTVWYLNQYDEDRHQEYRDRLIIQNFSGNISVCNSLF
ncbi:bacteriophage abortive infection AbiH family protein [Megasphaera elsdenii]